MNNNIVNAEIVQGVSQNTGKPYKFLTFSVLTSQGVYKTKPIFPTELEMSLIEKALNKFNNIYSEDEN